MPDFSLPSHVSKQWTISVETSTGEALSPADFEFFGAATAPGAWAVAMRSTQGEGSTVLTLPPLCQAGTWHYSVFCRQHLSGVTWQVDAGMITVTPSPCLAQPSLDPDPVLLTAMLAPETLQVTVTLGDSVAAAAAAAQQATQAAADAQTSQTAAAQSAANAQAAQRTAQTAAAEAQTSQTAAAQSAADAQTSKTAAAQSASAAQTSKTAAAQSATDAQDSQTAAAQSAADAQTSQTAAAQSAADAQTSKTAAAQSAADAQTSKTAAAQSAADAQTSKTAAAQSAADAQASQTKAQQAAQQSADNAELLGDAALKSGDNIFTGSNVFEGITNLLPADFWRYDCCTTGAEVRALAGESENFANWVYPLRNVNLTAGAGGWGNLFTFKTQQKGERLYLYSEWSNLNTSGALLWGKFVENWAGDTLMVYFPNMKGRAFHGFFTCTVVNVTIIIPNITSLNNYFFNFNEIKNLCIISKVESLNPIDFWIYGGGERRLKTLNLPLNKIKNVTWVNSAAMTQVLSGFPFATVVNFQKAKLDKASVLRILNSLQTYDAQTMETVPELTLGIDPTLDGDEEINAALLNAQTAVEDGGKGWSVAVSGFTITAGGVATMALRKPVYARRTRNDEGEYIDNDGARWSVRYGNTVLANWVANEQLGYEEFSTLEDALEQWGLSEFTPEPLTQN